MKDFFQKNKVSILIALVTCLLIYAGVMLMSGGNSSQSPTATIDPSLLISSESYTTSGIVNGKYEPASASATATLVEFGDYECTACSIYNSYINQYLTEYPGTINYTFRNYPLSYHANAVAASYAVEATGLQGKYWEMHDKVYSTQGDWSALEDVNTVFSGYAQEFGLDMEKYATDVESDSVKNKVENDYNDGNSVKLTETPTFYLNGIKMTAPNSYEAFKATLQAEANK